MANPIIYRVCPEPRMRAGTMIQMAPPTPCWPKWKRRGEKCKINYFTNPSRFSGAGAPSTSLHDHESRANRNNKLPSAHEERISHQRTNNTKPMVRMEMVIQNELEPWNQMPKDGIQKTPFVRFGSAAPNMSLPDRSLIKKPSCGSKVLFQRILS